MPAEKCLPVPVSTMTRQSGSASRVSKIWCSSSHAISVREFAFSGRLKRTVAMWSVRSTVKV